MSKTLLILGAGGHGKAVAEAALLSGSWHKVLFADDRWPDLTEVNGIKVVSDIKGIAVLENINGAIAAVGNNKIRESWVQQIQAACLPLVSIIHPRACVSDTAKIGDGTAIMAMAMVGVDVTLGRCVIVNANATVDHDAKMGDFAHLGVGVQVAGGVEIGARAWLQVGCCAGYNVKVPENQVIPPGVALRVDG